MNKSEKYSEDLNISRHIKISMTERSFLLSLGIHDLRLLDPSGDIGHRALRVLRRTTRYACFVKVIMSVSTDRLSLQVPKLT